MKLNQPEINGINKISVINLINSCFDEMGNRPLREKLEKGINGLLDYEKIYEKYAKSFSLYRLSRVLEKLSDDTVVISVLNRIELIRLYDQYFSSNKKNSCRKMYNAIMLSVERCPYCGGIGVPKNLDHYLPKALFPHFSILPLNLIPSCRDCNMGEKRSKFSSKEREQIIHPYIDNACFYNDQWIKARIVNKMSVPPYFSVEYFVDTLNWGVVEKDRALYHFEIFDLAKKYSIQAASEISTPINCRRQLFPRENDERFKSFLLSTAGGFHPNHWKSVLYQCLANDDWFLNCKFKHVVEL